MDRLTTLEMFVAVASEGGFAAAARKLRYATIGLIQYLAPTLVFFQGVLLFGEALTTVHIITFGLIWTGLLIYAADSLRAGRATPVSPPE